MVDDNTTAYKFMSHEPKIYFSLFLVKSTSIELTAMHNTDVQQLLQKYVLKKQNR